MIRWIKFNFVGAIGIVIQLGALFLLTAVGMSYLPATAIAVECAVLHNFVWHQRFTWPDRNLRQGAWNTGLIRFNMSTGLVSIGGNLLLMRLLVGQVHLPAVVANGISIAGCSLVNFLVADKWVFRISGQWPVVSSRWPVLSNQESEGSRPTIEAGDPSQERSICITEISASCANLLLSRYLRF